MKRGADTTNHLPRRLFAEFLGSAFLAAAVIGSGIAAAELSPNDVGLQLFENAAATAATEPPVRPYAPLPASSSATRTSTRRAMSSRVARTASSGRPAGSSRSQST